MIRTVRGISTFSVEEMSEPAFLVREVATQRDVSFNMATSCREVVL